MTKSTFSIDTRPGIAASRVGGIDRYVIVDALERPVLARRSNGQVFHLTYKTEQRAIRSLAEVRRNGYPDARVFDKEHRYV